MLDVNSYQIIQPSSNGWVHPSAGKTKKTTDRGLYTPCLPFLPSYSAATNSSATNSSSAMPYNLSSTFSDSSSSTSSSKYFNALPMSSITSVRLPPA